MKHFAWTECCWNLTYDIISAIPPSVLVNTRTIVVITFVLQRGHPVKHQYPYNNR